MRPVCPIPARFCGLAARWVRRTRFDIGLGYALPRRLSMPFAASLSCGIMWQSLRRIRGSLSTKKDPSPLLWATFPEHYFATYQEGRSKAAGDGGGMPPARQSPVPTARRIFSPSQSRARAAASSAEPEPFASRSLPLSCTRAATPGREAEEGASPERSCKRRGRGALRRASLGAEGPPPSWACSSGRGGALVSLAARADTAQ